MGKSKPSERKGPRTEERGSRECRTQRYWSGAEVKEWVVRMDVVMKGEESQKRKRSSRMQNINQTREQSGGRGEREMFTSSDKLSQTSALAFTDGR